MTPIARRPDWRSALVAWLHDVRKTPFDQSNHDCALFAAGAVNAMTGMDFAAAYRGRYTTTRGGLRVLRRDGFADHVALAAAHLPACPLSALREGDLVVIPAPVGRALGVVQGAMAYVPGLHGTGLMPVSAAQSAFQVG